MAVQYQLSISTPGRGLINITERINEFVHQAKVMTGLCHVFLHHTSASLIFCENADPLVQSDLETFMYNLVKDNDQRFQHNEEGPDDMPAHIRTILTQNFLSIPITNARLNLGTWQGIFLWEHRLQQFQRKMTVTIL